jgi:EAL domain-containing protein (putative c-di-GMP-specific phosphodiesterase class I)
MERAFAHINTSPVLTAMMSLALLLFGFIALKRLPVRGMKIDQSFVMEMARHDEVIVRSTIDLAHNLGLQIVAEGVESQEIWDRLVVLGCDAAQGNYVSGPLEPQNVAAWISEWESSRHTTV